MKTAKPSLILPPASALMTLPIMRTPSNIDASMLLAPSRKGLRFSINRDKWPAISGRFEVNPFAIPPARPPTNWPIAVPIFSRRFPPLETRSWTPGCLASSPRAIRTAPSSATIRPNARIPAIAAGVMAKREAKPCAISTNKPIQAVPFKRTSGFAFDKTSMTAENILANISTSDFINRGACLPIPSKIEMRNLNTRSTICGAYWTSASSTPTISFRAPWANSGIHWTNTPTSDLIAATRDDANSGTIPIIPRIITFKAATIEVAAVTVTVASIANP